MSVFKVVEKMILSNMFDFVAHLDNFKVFNYQVEDRAFLEGWYKTYCKGTNVY